MAKSGRGHVDCSQDMLKLWRRVHCSGIQVQFLVASSVFGMCPG